jgi:hypothetical protein
MKTFGSDFIPAAVYCFQAHTFVEIVESALKARAPIDRVLAGDLPSRLMARVLEDAGRFTYGERTILYYRHIFPAGRAEWSKPATSWKGYRGLEL